MSHKIYVGNYPVSFVEDDVLNLFQDFEGLELAGFFKNKNKCYSFLNCISERQLIEIVATLHDIDVCGRNLIVRAADENLQKRIQTAISKYGAANLHPRNTCDIIDSTSPYGHYESAGYLKAGSSKQSSPQTENSFSQNNDRRKYEMGPTTNAGHSTNPKRYSKQNYESHEYSPHSSESYYSSPQDSHYSQYPSGDDRKRNDKSYFRDSNGSERKTSDLSINPQETFSRFSKSKPDASGNYKTMSERFDSYRRNAMQSGETSASAGHGATYSSKNYQTRRRNISESSLDTVHNQPHADECDNLSFISVVNFPLYLPTRDLYKLFADYNPIKVFIVCNEPRMDKTPTEAIICFQSEKEATDAILTLDNTVFRGRVLIVTDAVDMSLVSELLSFG